MKRIAPLAGLLPALLCLVPLDARAQARDLPGFAAADIATSIATGVNAAGQVAAIVGDHEGKKHAAVHDGHRLVRLGNFGGKQSETAGINRDGVVVGSAESRDGRWHAFLYRAGEPLRDLGSLGGGSSFATGINDAGEVVGMARTGDDYFHAFARSAEGVMTDLGTLGGNVSHAAAINGKGHVVGAAATKDGVPHAFLYRPGQGLTDLGTFGGHASTATGINDAGLVVGAAQLPNRRWHAFIHDGRRMVDLGALIGYGDSFATGINSAGHVVGTIALADERRTFVYRDGKMAVHRAGKSLYLANGITDRGQVIGAYFNTKVYSAAAMPAAMAPVVDHGGDKLLTLSVGGIAAAVLAVMGRQGWRRAARRLQLRADGMENYVKMEDGVRIKTRESAAPPAAP